MPAVEHIIPALPFEDYLEFQAGYKSGRFLVGMKHNLPAIARALPASDVWSTFPFILSPFLLGVAFAMYAAITRHWWFLLALPVAWIDYSTSTGAIGMFRLLFWFPLGLAGTIVSLFYPSIGAAMMTIGFSFICSSLLCSVGLGIAKMALEARVVESEPEFRAAFGAGLVFLVDNATKTIHCVR